MNQLYQIKCVGCGSIFSEDETITRCLHCGEALDLEFDMKEIKNRINSFLLKNAPISSLKYLDFYPIKERSKIISLGEGNTPLIPAKILGEKYGVKNLYIKNEGANPTGVFKDRGSLVEITKAKELDAKGIVVASTGNMAASVSAYAARAGIPCYVVIPEGTPIGKLSQSLAYGGKILSLRGTYGDCVKISEKMAKKYGFLLAGDYAYRAEGQKSIAFEIIEQLSWNIPDVVIVPVGCGTNLSGIAKGFFEYFELGLISKIPRIIGVQPEKANTMEQEFKKGKEKACFIEQPSSLASAVNIGTPLDDKKAMKFVKKSNGTFAVIDDKNILLAQKDMATLASVFTEPSGAIPVACLPKLLKENIISPEETVVCIATGIGLKDPKSATLLFSEIPSLDPNIEDIDRFLTSGIAEIKSGKGDQKVLFSTTPNKNDLKVVLEKEFSFFPQKNPALFGHLQEEVDGFFQKKNEMKTSELQSLLEDVISDFDIPENPVLKLLDFMISDAMNKTAYSEVKIDFQGEKIISESNGTGPVDAAISAIEKAIAQKSDFKISLEDYQVKVPSGGLDAAVTVRMTLRDKEGNMVQTRSASPDIIFASLSAFTKGFCRLWEGKNQG